MKTLNTRLTSLGIIFFLGSLFSFLPALSLVQSSSFLYFPIFLVFCSIPFFSILAFHGIDRFEQSSSLVPLPMAQNTFFICAVAGFDTCQASSYCKNGVCVRNSTTLQCACPPGFTGSNCQSPVDYCHNITCFHESTCETTPSGYVCNCMSGYEGKHCEVETCQAPACASDVTAESQQV